MSLPISLFPRQQDAGAQAIQPEPQYDDIDYGMPDLGPQYPSVAVPSQDSGFLKWLFDFKDQTVEPLRHLWRGEEKDSQGKWVKSRSQSAIMNEKGVNWGISFIESFMSPAFVTSNYDREMMFYVMREATRSVYDNLCLRYKEFDLKKSDINRVAIEIESKIQAILLGARGDGYRKFFSSTTHTTENRNFHEQQEKKTGFMNKIGFKKIF